MKTHIVNSNVEEVYHIVACRGTPTSPLPTTSQTTPQTTRQLAKTLGETSSKCEYLTVHCAVVCRGTLGPLHPPHNLPTTLQLAKTLSETSSKCGTHRTPRSLSAAAMRTSHTRPRRRSTCRLRRCWRRRWEVKGEAVRRQWKGDGWSRRGSEKAVGGQGKAAGRQRKVMGRSCKRQ